MDGDCSRIHNTPVEMDGDCSRIHNTPVEMDGYCSRIHNKATCSQHNVRNDQDIETPLVNDHCGMHGIQSMYSRLISSQAVNEVGSLGMLREVGNVCFFPFTTTKHV
jgi:hypothetical protein